MNTLKVKTVSSWYLYDFYRTVTVDFYTSVLKFTILLPFFIEFINLLGCSFIPLDYFNPCVTFAISSFFVRVFGDLIGFLFMSRDPYVLKFYTLSDPCYEVRYLWTWFGVFRVFTKWKSFSLYLFSLSPSVVLSNWKVGYGHTFVVF